MIGDLFDSPWKILIVAVVLIVLFGSRKLPDAARSLGKSMRILKREVRDLREDEDEPQPAPAITKPASAEPSAEELQKQIRDLQARAAAAEGAKPVTETQRSQAS